MPDTEYEIKTENNESYLPERLGGIKVGDEVRFRAWAELFEDYKQGKVRSGLNSYMESLCGTIHIISENDMLRIGRQEDNIWTIDMPQKTVGISLDMLEFVNREPQLPSEEVVQTSIVNAVQDEAIIKEMIGKVNKMRFKKLMVIAGNSSAVKMDTISQDVLDKYLDIWARAKYDFYIMFGKQFVIEKSIEIDMTEDDMNSKVRDLCTTYPVFSNMLRCFSSNEFLENKCMDNNSTLAEFYPAYTYGTKLSKLLAGLTQNKEFSDDLATMLETRKIKTRLAISIDPYDYLTESMNNYSWQSCHEIGNGSYATGAGSILLDSSTLVAFRYNGTEETFKRKRLTFVGNSKAWRQAIYFDKENSAFVGSRQYPRYNDALAKEIRLILEKQISDYLGIENSWGIARNGRINYEVGADNMYHDFKHGSDTILAKPKSVKKTPHVVVGAELYCVKCGAPINDTRESYICSRC